MSVHWGHVLLKLFSVSKPVLFAFLWWCAVSVWGCEVILSLCCDENMPLGLACSHNELLLIYLVWLLATALIILEHRRRTFYMVSEEAKYIVVIFDSYILTLHLLWCLHFALYKSQFLPLKNEYMKIYQPHKCDRRINQSDFAKILRWNIRE